MTSNSPADLDFLIDQTVSQVCLGLHEIVFHLDDRVSITIESDFEIRLGSTIERFRSVVPGASSAAELIGKTVTGVALDQRRSLVISFADHEQLTAIKSSDDYDCYRVQTDAFLFVV